MTQLNVSMKEKQTYRHREQTCGWQRGGEYSVLNIHWKDWCWSSNTLATWCKELSHWKRPWCWERLKVGGEGDDRGWDVWMASLTQWTWVWVSSGSWWWTGKPGVLQSMGLQRVRHDWVTELNWTESSLPFISFLPPFLLPFLLVHWFRWGASENLYYNWEKSYTYENIIYNI